VSQCHNHEGFMEAALNFGWQLHEYGYDSDCIVGGKTPHLALIWLKPCAWDPEQMLPVGCACCTDLDQALMDWHEELWDIMEHRRILKGLGKAVFTPTEPPEVLAARPDWLAPYRAR
jgi:hypothetical protein